VLADRSPYGTVIKPIRVALPANRNHLASLVCPRASNSWTAPPVTTPMK
jgi:hypothetical protein